MYLQMGWKGEAVGIRMWMGLEVEGGQGVEWTLWWSGLVYRSTCAGLYGDRRYAGVSTSEGTSVVTNGSAGSAIKGLGHY